MLPKLISQNLKAGIFVTVRMLPKQESVACDVEQLRGLLGSNDERIVPWQERGAAGKNAS
jgi:hypothetical protein